MTEFSQQYTATGTNTVDISKGHDITYAISSDNGDATYTFKAALKDGGTYHSVSADAITEGLLYVFNGGCESVQLDITNMGTCTYVQLDILGRST